MGGSRDPVSDQRQRAPEKGDIVGLLSDSQWEIGNLLEELDGILGHESIQYQAYPRLRAALTLHLGAIAAILPQLEHRADLAELTADWKRAGTEWESLLRELDRYPWKDEQAHRPEWQETFAMLLRRVSDVFSHNDQSVLPTLLETVPEEERLELGKRYKEAMSRKENEVSCEQRDQLPPAA